MFTENVGNGQIYDHELPQLKAAFENVAITSQKSLQDYREETSFNIIVSCKLWSVFKPATWYIGGYHRHLSTMVRFFLCQIGILSGPINPHRTRLCTGRQTITCNLLQYKFAVVVTVIFYSDYAYITKLYLLLNLLEVFMASTNKQPMQYYSCT